MKTLNKKTVIGMGAVGLLLLSGSAIAGNAPHSAKAGWQVVCHQQETPKEGTTHQKILFVPLAAAGSTTSDHKGSGKPGNPGGGHDDFVIGDWVEGVEYSVEADCPVPGLPQ